MTNYLALIRKADFTDLFKYGKLHINNDMKTDFSCAVEELPSHPEIFFNLTHFANSFDSAFAYLIIHYVKTSSRGLANDVIIEEVQNVYPLDFESKEAFSLSFDERIRIGDPIWPESAWNLQKQQQFNDCLKGAANLRKILGFTSSDEECKAIISDDIVREVVNELYDEKRPTGELPIWVYLLRYDRHSFYPQTTLGYFMDMVNIVCNRMAMREVEEDDIRNTQIFMLMNSLRKYPEAQYKWIYQHLIDNPNTQGFFKKIDEFESRVEFSKVATLFLILKNRYKDDFIYEGIFIDYCKTFGFEFELAVYLLGIIMGHEHTYDCMYDILPLPIFKKAIKAKSHVQDLAEVKDYHEHELSEVCDTFTEVSIAQDEKLAQNPAEVKNTPAQNLSDVGDSSTQISTAQKEVSTQEQHSSSQMSEEKNLFGEDTIRFPIYMRRPTGGKARTIKNEKDYAKKHFKNLLDGYTIESYD